MIVRNNKDMRTLVVKMFGSAVKGRLDYIDKQGKILVAFLKGRLQPLKDVRGVVVHYDDAGYTVVTAKQGEYEV